MAMMKLRVTYSDGRVETVLGSPRAQVMTEEKFDGIGSKNRLRASYYLAWVALHKAGREPCDYEVFLDSIDDVEEVEDAESEKAADPTPEEPPTTTSLD